MARMRELHTKEEREERECERVRDRRGNGERR
jgi:hypothetical protein